MSYTRRMRRSLLAVLSSHSQSCRGPRRRWRRAQLRAARQRIAVGGVRPRRRRPRARTTDRRFIESVVTVEILRGLKGNAGESIAFTVPGGQVGRYLNVIPGAPSFAPAISRVFFLTAQGPRLAGDDRIHAGSSTASSATCRPGRIGCGAARELMRPAARARRCAQKA